MEIANELKYYIFVHSTKMRLTIWNNNTKFLTVIYNYELWVRVWHLTFVYAIISDTGLLISISIYCNTILFNVRSDMRGKRWMGYCFRKRFSNVTYKDNKRVCMLNCISEPIPVLFCSLFWCCYSDVEFLLGFVIVIQFACVWLVFDVKPNNLHRNLIKRELSHVKFGYSVVIGKNILLIQTWQGTFIINNVNNVI